MYNPKVFLLNTSGILNARHFPRIPFFGRGEQAWEQGVLGKATLDARWISILRDPQQQCELWLSYPNKAA